MRDQRPKGRLIELDSALPVFAKDFLSVCVGLVGAALASRWIADSDPHAAQAFLPALTVRAQLQAPSVPPAQMIVGVPEDRFNGMHRERHVGDHLVASQLLDLFLA